MKKIISVISLFLFSTSMLWGQQTFENKKIGFAMQEPKGWIVASNEELKKNIELLDLSEELLEQAAKTGKSTILLTAYYKYKASKTKGVNPKIQVDIRPKNTKDFQQFKFSITQSAESLKKYFENYEFIEEPNEIEISGIKSIGFVGKFTMKTQNGQELKVRARIYAIPYKSYFFQVNLVDDELGEDNSKLFDELVKTIKIGN